MRRQQDHRFRLRWLSGVLFLSSFLVCLWFGQLSVAAQSPELLTNPSAAQQVQQGVDRYRAGDYQESIALWQFALNEYRRTNQRENEAIVLENLARAYQQLGQSSEAIAAWEQVVVLYRWLDNPGEIGRAFIELAQIYSSMGQTRQAITLLCGSTPQEEQQQELEKATQLRCQPGTAVQIAREIQDPVLESAALGSLGNAYRLVGRSSLAITAALEPSLTIARRLNNIPYQISALNSLGNAYISFAQLNNRRAEFAEQRNAPTTANQLRANARTDDIKALTYFEQSRALAEQQGDRMGEVRSLLSAVPTYYRTDNPATATAALSRIQEQISGLPMSREQVYARIDLAKLLQMGTDGKAITGASCPASPASAQVETLLRQAIDTAQQLQDFRAVSFASGELGYVYECWGKFPEALALTQQARWAADQNLQARDSLYLWEWQTGRILKAQNQMSAAIEAYQRAAATLETIRGDILTAARDVQFNFRDTVEPLYRDLIALELGQETIAQAAKSTTATAAENTDENKFKSILKTIDSLRLAELQNYFGNDCVIVPPQQGGLNAEQDTKTAVINTFILDTRTAVIANLPDGSTKLSWINVSQAELRAQVNQYRYDVSNIRRKDYNPRAGQQIYDWLVRPFLTDLEQANVETLVFVQDGIFRSVPMAALQDGDQYLIEQYAVATTPSLALTASTVTQQENLRILALGLAEAVKVDGAPFSALPGVTQELQGIRAALPNSRELLNQDFTRARLQAELRRTVFSVIHIATHGKFSAEPEDTFIITGDSEKLTFSELDRLIRDVTRNPNPLKLLALTACETAAGDDRAALGLAGVAVQAGAESALASLWLINDAIASQMAVDFYSYLKQPGMSRAAALRMAQVAALRGKTASEFIHPGLWSPLVLVGNWR